MTLITSVVFLNLCMLVAVAMAMAMGRIGNSTLSSSSSSWRPSVVNVGALFTMDSVIGRSVKPALEAAIEDVNSNPNVFGGTKLSLISRHTNCTGFLRTADALELMEKNVVAIIGPQSSELAHVISQFANKVQVPLLSFGATDPTLSSLENKFFVRTTQSDYFQMNAIADLVEYYGWKEVTAIYIDDEYGRNGISVLGDALAKRRTKISFKSSFVPGAPKHAIHDILVEVKRMESQVYIIHVNPDSGLTIFSEAKYLQMMTDGYVWIATDWLSSVLDSSSDQSIVPMDLLQGVIALRHHTPDSNIKENFTTRWKNLNSYALYAYDSVWLLARALDAFFTEGGNITFSRDPRLRGTNGSALCLASLSIFDEGQRLLEKLTEMNFTGLSGQIQFDEWTNLIHPAYDILNIGWTSSRRIGYWSNYSGLSVIPPEILYMNPPSPNTSTRNQQNLYSVIWPGESTIKPRGWVFPNNGKPLRIAVPYRVSYTDFATKDKGPIGASGYCIDVFEAAVKLLPYRVPRVYILYGNGQTYPNYNDMLKDIAQNKYDAGVGDININTKRTRILDFTEPYMESELVIVSHVEKVSSTTWAFLKPFTVEMWCVTGAAFLFVGIVIWILEHQVNHEFRSSPRQRLITVLWFSFSTMVFAHRQNIASTLGRLVMIIWLFVVLIINSSYTASLSSILTAQKLTSRIEGIDSLKSSSDPIGVVGGSSAKDHLIYDLNIKESRVRILETQQDFVEALRRGPEGGGVAAIVDELPYVESLLPRTNCEFEVVGQVFKKTEWGFAFQRDFPLVVDLSTAILQLSDNGALQIIHDKWFGHNRCSLQANQVNSTSKLSLMSFWGLFLICGIACFLSLVVFFCGVFRKYLENSPEEDEENIREEPESTRTISTSSFKDFVDKEDTEIEETVEMKIIDNKQEAGQSSGGH